MAERIKRGGKRIRGSDGKRTRNEDCCCDSDDCGATGSRPEEIQITIPAGCTSHAGAHLLTNAGTYAQFIAATGFPFDPEAEEETCWVWWEETGVTAGEWYYAGVNASGSSTFGAIRTAPSNGDFWAAGPPVNDWSDLDGMVVFWFGEFGTSPCPGGDPGDLTIDIPP